MRGASDGEGRSGRDTVVLATTLYGLLSVLFMVVAVASLVNALTARSLICAYSQGDPHCVRNAWVWAFFALALAVTSTYAVVRLKGERRGQRRRAWWVGIVAGLLIALPGVVIVLSPIWSYNAGPTEMLPELFGGLLIMAVAGVLIGSLLASGTRRCVREGPSPVPAPSADDGLWRVAAPGADLTDRPGGVGIGARLASGTVLVEVKRRQDHIKVIAPDGRTGWVEGRAVV